MTNGSLTVFEYIEDYDNADLSMDERIELLEDAVDEYNWEYGTNYSLSHTVYEYVKSKYYGHE